MSAPTLEVRRLHARYRVGGGGERTRARLDRLLSSVAGTGLDAALVRLGVGWEEEICIRSVRAPVRLQLATSDDAICAAWSGAIVAAIDAAASGGGRDVIRYPSRRHAVVDLVRSVARADYTRSWAWRRLGLWAVGEDPSGTDAAEALVDALCSDPVTIVPALVSVARARSLAPLLTLLDERRWTLLAMAALGAAGAPADVARSVTTGAQPARSPSPAPGAAASASSPLSEPRNSLFFEGTGESVLRRSQIAAAVVALRPVALGLGTISSIATLCVLEDDPAALVSSAARASRAIAAVAEALRHAPIEGGKSDPSRPEPATQGATEEPSDASGARPSSTLSQGDSADAAIAEGHGERESHGEAVSASVAPSGGGALGTDEPAGGAPTEARADPAAPPIDARADPAAPPIDADALPVETDAWTAESDAPVRYSTRFGGLMFFLPFVAELDLPASPPEALAQRRLRWVLHQLALILQPLEPDDPAALAFAGLPPDAELPTAAEEPPTAEERLALARTRHMLVELLRIALAEPHRPPDELLDFVCRRRAEVVGDPGWIELRFELDEVSIELRRAGLDLDPGWVPWLGAVVRFVYV